MQLSNETPSETWMKVLRALRALGFREAQARRAIAEAAKLYRYAPSVEQALREAVLAATAHAA